MAFWKRGGGGPRIPRSANAAVREALYAVLEHDLDTAERMLSEAARLDPDEIDAYLLLGRLYRDRGEVGRAIRIHQNLLLRPDLPVPRSTDVLVELASDFRAGGFLRRAIASFEEVLTRDRRHPRALRELAGLLASVREHEHAIEIERRLARVEGRDAAPREAELWVELARDAEAEGRAGDARKALRKALRRDARNVDAWTLLGRIEAERGRGRAALSAWRKVPEIDRAAGPRVYPQLAASFAAAGEAGRFEAYLRELLEAGPEDARARLALAGALAARGAEREALEEIRRVLERAPDDLEARAALGRTLRAAGDEAEALKVYEDLLVLLEREGFLLHRPEALE